MSSKISKHQIRKLTEEEIGRHFGCKIEEATQLQLYRAVCAVIMDVMAKKYVDFSEEAIGKNAKKVYYMSMEFLVGRSLKNNLFNLGLTKEFSEAFEDLGVHLEELYEFEPDAALGNGGLGRLASCYMDALTTGNFPAQGFSIRYDYGIFKQKIVDGWQTELPETWLENGDVWLIPRIDETFEVHFDGHIEEVWTENGLETHHKDFYKVLAVPYDLPITGFGSDAVNNLRLWSAKSENCFDMCLFSQGEYVKAIEQNAIAESISKVLYPADNHIEGKSLRLKQQYFFVSASMQNITKEHFERYKTLSNLYDYVAVHINDTHPSLCVPELMRILLDDYKYSWDEAFYIVNKTIAYTNHTVMSEALERWPISLFSARLPRIYSIVKELNERFCKKLWTDLNGDFNKISQNAIIANDEVRMANLCIAACNHINGVSALHTNILKQDVFKDLNHSMPEKFLNITNGIAHRRWLCQSNNELSTLIEELIGDGFKTNGKELEKLIKYKNNSSVLERLEKIKLIKKQELSNYILSSNGIKINPYSVFDVQIKRLHEYKRQLLNALHILHLYLSLKDNPNLEMNQKTFIFGAKASPGYYMAKQIIRLISAVGKLVNNDVDIKDKLKVVFLENYRVTLAEIIIPAAEISEQISIAGKEASGTGNMKLMINGAITIGTLDGANVEMLEEVGQENIFIFGLKTNEVEELWRQGYNPTLFYNKSKELKRVIDFIRSGVLGDSFSDIVDSLLLGKNTTADPYMCLVDFESYVDIHSAADKAYSDRALWNNMSLMNIAKAGFFCADRSVDEYAKKIWNMKRV